MANPVMLLFFQDYDVVIVAVAIYYCFSDAALRPSVPYNKALIIILLTNHLGV